MGCSNCCDKKEDPCVVLKYNGQDIECLGVKKGDTFESTIQQIADFVCDIQFSDGEDGQGIDHVSFTSTTGTSQGEEGQTDTYTVWGDSSETINLGDFLVYNGADGEDGVDGQGISHVSFTTSTGTPSDVENQPGETDTYTVWGDSGGSLGTYTVYNGQDALSDCECVPKIQDVSRLASGSENGTLSQLPIGQPGYTVQADGVFEVIYNSNAVFEATGLLEAAVFKNSTEVYPNGRRKLQVSILPDPSVETPFAILNLCIHVSNVSAVAGDVISIHTSSSSMGNIYSENGVLIVKKIG